MRCFLLISLLSTCYHSGSSFVRDKRYLVFPPPSNVAPTKVQIRDSEIGLEATTGRRTFCLTEVWNGCMVLPRNVVVAAYDLKNGPSHLILGLGLPMEVDVSMIIGYVMKFNYVLPYNASYLTDPYVRYDRSISPGVEVDGNDAPTSDHQGAARVINRWEIYEILESVLGDSRSGKACLLRAICEASAAPFNRVHGLSSQLVHLLLTPSTTSEPFRTDFDRVYHAAEIMGRQGVSPCDNLFAECTESPLDYFTEVYE